MDKNSEIIRIEIIRILNENGKIRGTELANRVIKKVGNEKTENLYIFCIFNARCFLL